jgi:hypothetical protein
MKVLMSMEERQEKLLEILVGQASGKQSSSKWQPRKLSVSDEAADTLVVNNDMSGTSQGGENSTYVCRALMARVSHTSFFGDEVSGDEEYLRTCEEACQEICELSRRVTELETLCSTLRTKLEQVTDDRDEAYLMVDVLTGELIKIKGEKNQLKVSLPLRATHRKTSPSTSSVRSSPVLHSHHRNVRKPLPVAKVTGISEDLLCTMFDDTLHDVMRRHGRTVPQSYMRRHLSTPSTPRS